jgi:hypothetical protein
MHVGDGPRMFHVTNVRVTLDVRGPERPCQPKVNMWREETSRTVLHRLGRTTSPGSYR